MIFQSWASVGHVVMSVAIAYIAVVVLLRIVGEQALAQMTAYDFIVTITLGSLVAGIPLTHDLSLVDGLVAIVAFVALQELIRFLQTRSGKIRRVIADPPRVVLWNGELLHDRLHHWNVNIDEVRAAVRRSGHAYFSDVQAVVLENDGDWSVIARKDGSADGDAFEGLDHP